MYIYIIVYIYIYIYLYYIYIYYTYIQSYTKNININIYIYYLELVFRVAQQKNLWPLAKLPESRFQLRARSVEDGMKTGYGILERPAARRGMADQNLANEFGSLINGSSTSK